MLVKVKQRLWATQWPHSMSRGVCLLNLINPTQQVAVSLDLLPTGKWDTLPEGSLCFVCDLYSHSETARGKSLWIHQKEQKNYPWRFPKKVVGFSLGLSSHKSSSTNRVEQKSKSGNRSTCWAYFCGVALKLRQISWHVPNSIHVASNMANFRGCLKAPGTSSEDEGIPPGGGGTSYKWANGDVPLDGVAVSRLDWL